MQANENIAETSTRVAKSLAYTPGAASLCDNDGNYTGGIMPDSCAVCGNCCEFFQQLSDECPFNLIDGNFADQTPMPGDSIISNLERCSSCSQCVDYWNNNIVNVCPVQIKLKLAPESQPEPQDWFTLSKKSGSGNDTISIEAQPNAKRYCREGIITVASGSGGISKQVKLLQYGAATYRLSLVFVGVQEGNSFKISSCFYAFLNDAAEDEDSNYEISIKLLNDGLPFQFPDSSSELVLSAPIKKGSTTSGVLGKTFTTSFKVSSKTALSFYAITASSSAGDVYVSKDTSTCRCTEETFGTNVSSISAPADGKTSTVSVKTQAGVTWIVE